MTIIIYEQQKKAQAQGLCFTSTMIYTAAGTHTHSYCPFLLLIMSPNDGWPFTAWGAGDELKWWGQWGRVAEPAVTPYRGCQPSFGHFKVV